METNKWVLFKVVNPLKLQQIWSFWYLFFAGHVKKRSLKVYEFSMWATLGTQTSTGFDRGQC